MKSARGGDLSHGQIGIGEQAAGGGKPYPIQIVVGRYPECRREEAVKVGLTDVAGGGKVGDRKIVGIGFLDHALDLGHGIGTATVRRAVFGEQMDQKKKMGRSGELIEFFTRTGKPQDLLKGGFHRQSVGRCNDRGQGLQEGFDSGIVDRKMNVFGFKGQKTVPSVTGLCQKQMTAADRHLLLIDDRDAFIAEEEFKLIVANGAGIGFGAIVETGAAVKPSAGKNLQFSQQ